MEERMNLKIHGIFLPVFFLPTFYLQNTSLEWDQHVKVISGTLRVDYDLFSFLPGDGLSVRLSGKKLSVELLGDWAAMEGVRSAQIDRFEAKFKLGKEGIREIDYFTAESPAFQFRLKRGAAHAS